MKRFGFHLIYYEISHLSRTSILGLPLVSNSGWPQVTPGPTFNITENFGMNKHKQQTKSKFNPCKSKAIKEMLVQKYLQMRSNRREIQSVNEIFI